VGEGAFIDPPVRVLHAIDQHHRDELPVKLAPERVVFQGDFVEFDIERVVSDFGNHAPSVVAEVTAGLSDQCDGDRHGFRLRRVGRLRKP
jgi:hypothetical protein